MLASPEKLYPRDADEEDHVGVDDMTKLAYLNEPGVLYNLQRRYALNDIYVSQKVIYFFLNFVVVCDYGRLVSIMASCGLNHVVLSGFLFIYCL